VRERRYGRPHGTAVGLTGLLRAIQLPRLLLGLAAGFHPLREPARAARGRDRDLRLQREDREGTGRLRPGCRPRAARARDRGGDWDLLDALEGAGRARVARPGA